MITGNSDECRQGKLLSARMIVAGTGKLMAQEVMQTLNEWGVTHQIYGICFDTTSSNTASTPYKLLTTI